MDKQEPVAKFKVGDPVQRAEPRSYLFPGIVIGANLKLDGKTWLYSVECIAPGVEGMVHEFTERALEARANRPADDCPSCHGLNISCPEGCGRDPLTGELNGTTLIRPADEPSALLAQIKRDVETVASWPEDVRRNYEAELRAVFHNPGITFPNRPADDGLEQLAVRLIRYRDNNFPRGGSPVGWELLTEAATALRAQSDAEVERIVAWLRGQAAIYNEQNPNLSALPEWTLAQKWANAIERGEHRKDGA